MIIDLLLIILLFTVLISVFLMALYCKIRKYLKEPKNKVRFYVKMVEDGMPWLYIQKRNGDLEFVACDTDFINFDLNPLDFYNMKAGEIREVFLNTKD